MLNIFALQITLIFVLICDKYFTMCKIDRTFIIFDFDTNNGHLSETIRIMVIRIDFELKSGNGFNTNILAQMKK